MPVISQNDITNDRLEVDAFVEVQDNQNILWV